MDIMSVVSLKTLKEVMIKTKELLMEIRLHGHEDSVFECTKRSDEICTICLTPLDIDGYCRKCLIDRQQRNETRNF